MPLVRVCDMLDLNEALVIQSMLIGYGVPATIAGQELSHQLQYVLPPLTGVYVLVSDCDLPTAQRLISDSQSNV